MLPKYLPPRDTSRRILHLDMDAFYASVEMRDAPSLRDKAVIIAQDPRTHNGHGVVATASYEARRYGVHSAMPAIQALRLIPAAKLAIVEPHFEKYRAVSNQIHELMHQLTDRLESVALDEAYLDLTTGKSNRPYLDQACWLQQQVYRQIGITSSFGLSYNKFLAKMGSETAKPFGRTVVLPEEAERFLAAKPLAAFHGIGQATQERLAQLGMNTGADLQKCPVLTLTEKFGKAGYAMALHAHGIDNRPVGRNPKNQSISVERSYEPPLFDEQQLLTALRSYSKQLAGKMVQNKLLATGVVLKIRDRDFVTVTRSQRLSKPTREASELFPPAKTLLAKVPDFAELGVRLLGLGVNVVPAGSIAQEINLFD